MVEILIFGVAFAFSSLDIVLEILLVGSQERDVLGASRHDGRVVGRCNRAHEV
jgi:hypothetical protein